MESNQPYMVFYSISLSLHKLNRIEQKARNYFRFILIATDFVRPAAIGYYCKNPRIYFNQKGV